MSIIFGTDGWRGIIADDFTFENVGLVAHAAAQFFKKQPNASKGIVIGYDARFLSRQFAELTARICVSEGLSVFLTNGIASTPQVSLAAKKKKLAGGIIITASHNPAEYNGFKLKAGYGGPSAPEDISQVQKNIDTFLAKPQKFKPLQEYDALVKAKKIKLFDAKKDYLEYIRTKIDLNLILNSGFKIVYDPMYGSGIYTLDRLIPDVVHIHNDHNPSFGELDHPEPLGEYLGRLSSEVIRGKYTIGIATDGDADRLGAIDEEGNFVDSHRIFVLLMKYLYEDKKQKGAVVKTVSLTTMINNYCTRNNIKLYETPVGFKHTAKLMTTEKIVIGGEESGGLGTILHIPERDGLFNALLLLEMMAKRKKTLGQLSNELDREFGPHRYRRIDLKMSNERKNAIMKKAASGIRRIGNFGVINTNTTDGFKFFVVGGWLLIRASGTEPLIRFYAEADSAQKVNELLKAGITLA